MRSSLLFTLLLGGCFGGGVGEVLELEGGFENDRRPDFAGTVFAWWDRTFFNAGYQEREQPALELLATRSVFDPSEDLSKLRGDGFLDLQKDFRFADAFRMRIASAETWPLNQPFGLDSESPDPSLIFALKIGAEPLGEDLDDPRNAFRLPGHLNLDFELLALDEAQVEGRIDVSVKRCEAQGEGPAYRPGNFSLRFVAPLIEERISEHNVKVLLGLSTLPLPDPNGFSFPGFTQNCNTNPRPPID